jgi:hypothetical protein
VQFQDNGADLGDPVPLDASGQASYTSASLSIGTHSITAGFSGDADYTASAGALQVTVKAAFVAALPLPDQISTDPAVAGSNALLVLVWVLLFYFAGTLFNNTFKENYAAIESWSGGVRRWFGRFKFMGGDHPGRYWEFLLIVLLSAVINSFVEPDLGFNREGLVIFIAMLVGGAALTCGYDGIQALTMRGGFHIPARVKAYPLAIPIAVVFILISRLIGFSLGLLFGFVGAFTVVSTLRRPDERQSSLAVIAGVGVVFAASIGAFFLRQPLASLDQTFWVRLADTVCVAVFAFCLEGVVFGLLPFATLDGGVLFKWKKWVWGLVFFLAVFVFWYIIINPGNVLTQAVSGMKFISMAGVIGFFVVMAVLFWLYFRLRRPPEAPGEKTGPG